MMDGSRQVSVLLPVKALHLAKQRLAPLLTASERQQLAAVMLEDVVEACLAADVFRDITVVTNDPDVIAMTDRLRIAAIEQDTTDGLNAAIRTGLRRMPSDSGIVILPADVPSVTATALRHVAEHCAAKNTFVLARAKRDGGTNLLACSQAGLVEPSFGPDSFARHCASARRIGIEPIQTFPEEPDLDLDYPEDLRSFIAMKTTTRTHGLLMEWNVPARLDAVAARVRSLA